MKIFERCLAGWAVLPVALVMLLSAAQPVSWDRGASGAELRTGFEVPASLIAKLARGPVSAREAFQGIRLTAEGESSQMLVLFAAAIREGRVVAVQESRPFKFQPGLPLFSVPLFPGGWAETGYVPGPFYLQGDRFLPGDMFAIDSKYLPADRFAAAMRPGNSSATLERSTGVFLIGSDALVLGVVPADAGVLRTAIANPIWFIVDEIGLGP